MPGGSQNDFSFLVFVILPQGFQFFVGILASFFGVVFGVIRLNDKETTTTTMTTTTAVVRKKPKELQLRNLTLNYIIFSFIFILSAVGSSPMKFTLTAAVYALLDSLASGDIYRSIYKVSACWSCSILRAAVCNLLQ